MSFIYIFFSLVAATAGIFYFFFRLGRTPSSSDSVSALLSKDAVPNQSSKHSGGNKTKSDSINGSGQPVCVLFGSQTGTAEMFAKTLVREGTSLGIPMELHDVENYESYRLENERLVILICATYGEGEPTDSMKSFHDYIMDDCRQIAEEFPNLLYTVFALGDKQYKYFCEEGILMDRRLESLGARRVYGLCCGDAGDQIEEQFDAWRHDLWPSLARELNIKLREHIDEPVEPECRIKYWQESAPALPFPKMTSVLEPTQRLPSAVKVIENEELLNNCRERSTRRIVLNIKDTNISYQGGDHLGILPCNPDWLVDEYLHILNVPADEAEKVFSLQDKKTLKNIFPTRVTVRMALKWYIDLAGVPKKSTLRAFAHFCKDSRQKDELLGLLNAPTNTEYVSKCRQLRNMHGFMSHYRSMRVPLAFFLEFMPRICPRYYSISSDPLFLEGKLALTIALVTDGLCSSMLEKTKEGDTVFIFVRKSNFHLPLRDKKRAVIMIGPGTGIAPFIGFLERRLAWKKKNNDNGNILGKSILFFGCRKQSEDHIYRSFCEQCVTDGHVLSDLDTAYSRETETKDYVQHHLQKRSKEVWDLIMNHVTNEAGDDASPKSATGANIYICGDAKHMAKDVEKVLLEAAMTHGGLSHEEAVQFYKKLEQEERYLKDVWSSSL